MKTLEVKEYQTSEYNKLHRWLKSEVGSASHCSNKECPGTCQRFAWALKTGEHYAKDVSKFEALCFSCHSKRADNNSKLVRISENEQTAQAIARIYPSTYKKISAIAKKRRTSLAQVIAEKFCRA